MKLIIFSFITLLLSGMNLVSQLGLVSQVNAQEVEINLYTGAKKAGVPGADTADPDDAGVGFGLFIGQVLNIILVIAALMVFLYLIWGGMEWISAGGDKSKIEKARNRIMQSVIGLIVLASMIALFIVMQSFLGIDLFVFI